MIWVAKYKKIKACDPYSKKNGGKVDLASVGIWGLGDNGRKPKKRSRRAEMLRANKKSKREQDNGFDLPPNERCDEFDMKDLVGSVKRQKLINPMKEMIASDKDSFKVDLVPVNGNVATIPKTDEDEKKLARLLNVKTQVKREDEKKESKKHARMEGESKNAYNKRTKAETRQIIKQTTTEQKNPEKKLKKKEFLTNKKKKKKGSLAPSENVRGNQDDSDSEVLITGERAIAFVDEVKFGEQAERPPTFRQLPRGAKKKDDALKNKTAEKASRGMTQEDVDAESKAMDLMRRKIQAQYAAIKVKRRIAGDFHL